MSFMQPCLTSHPARFVGPCLSRAVDWALAIALLFMATGCDQPVPAGSLVVTQVPAGLIESSPVPGAGQDRAGAQSSGVSEVMGRRTVLDVRYPVGSRLVLAVPGAAPEDVRVLSTGLWSAGGPVVAPDGRRVLFVGRASAGADWQVYEANLAGGTARLLTSVPGGAMDPAWLKDGAFVFASPVPDENGLFSGSGRPQLFAKSPATGKIARLTFAELGAADPTLLRDGRILFVSARPGARADEPPHTGLFTVNNDGTEVSGFACQHDGPGWVRRPRFLGRGRIGFLTGADLPGTIAESVLMARPAASRAPMAEPLSRGVTSLEPDGQGGMLFCQPSMIAGQSSWAVYQLGDGASREENAHAPAERNQNTPNVAVAGRLEEPPCERVFDDPLREEIEAVALRPHAPPMGRVSTMDPTKTTGQLLCLDVNYSTVKSPAGSVEKAARVRVFAVRPDGQAEILGEAPVLADGSMLAEVPADLPLGFEALDQQGRVLRRQPPLLWVRAGENRSCVGCHEPHHRAPRNDRPLAVNQPPVRLLGPGGAKLLISQHGEIPAAEPGEARSTRNHP